MLKARDSSCGWATDPVRQTWRWNDGISNSVSEKWRLGKESKQGNTSKEKHQAKKNVRRTVYQVKYKAEKKLFGNTMQRDD